LNDVTIRIGVAMFAALAATTLEFKNPSRWNCLARWAFGALSVWMVVLTYRAECALGKLTAELGQMDKHNTAIHNFTNAVCVVVVVWAVFVVVYGTITYRRERWICGG
jgi:hypothetical protein